MNTENAIEVFEMVKEVKATLNKDVIINAINEKIKQRKNNTHNVYQDRISEEFDKLKKENDKKLFFKTKYTREIVESLMNKDFPLKRMLKINDDKYLKKYRIIKEDLIDKNEISMTDLTEVLGIKLDVEIKNY